MCSAASAARWTPHGHRRRAEADLQDVLISLPPKWRSTTSTSGRCSGASRSPARTVDLQQQTLELTQFRAQAGLATDLDVQQALSNVETTRAQIASLETSGRQSMHAMSILVGQAAAELNAELSTPGPIPAAPIDATLGVPADALRRRPDVRGAERQVAAQAAQVNVARADLYPTFRLAGSIGLESLSIAKVLLPGASFWSVGPSASTRLFDRAQLRENLASERAPGAGGAQL